MGDVTRRITSDLFSNDVNVIPERALSHRAGISGGRGTFPRYL